VINKNAERGASSMYLGDTVFMSYRTRQSDDAVKLGHWLVGNGWCQNVLYIEPGGLAESNEILLIYDIHELTADIVASMNKCDAAVAFNTKDSNDVWKSHWTRMEKRQWQRISNKLEIHEFTPSKGANGYTHTVNQLKSLSENERSILTKISVGTDRQSVRDAPHAVNMWGKFAKSCFVVPCVNADCHKYFLATEKVIYKSIAGEFEVKCPHCQQVSQFVEGSEKGRFHRKRIYYVGESDNQEDLDENLLSRLMYASEVPETFGKLVKYEDEIIISDFTKLGLVYGGIVLGLAAVLAISSKISDYTKKI
jgi:hypothetical protein